MQKVQGLKCKLCGKKFEKWTQMKRHLAHSHKEISVPETVTGGIKLKLISYVFGENNTQPKKQNKKTKKAEAPLMQEIVIPLVLRIPIVLGNVRLCQIEKE